MDKQSYEIRINKWMEIIQAANASNLSKSEWCKQNGVTKRTFYYWQRKVQDYLLETGMVPKNMTSPVPATPSILPDQPVFCEISEPVPEQVMCSSEQIEAGFKADAVIRCGPINILINEETSDRTLAKLISALRNDI